MATSVKMRLFASADEYIITANDAEETLRCSRVDGTLCPGRPLLDHFEEEETKGGAPAVVGDIQGVIGKIRLFSGWRLIVITESTCVGQIAAADVFRIDKIAVLPLLKDVDPLSDMQNDGDEKEGGQATPSAPGVSGQRSPRPTPREEVVVGQPTERITMMQDKAPQSTPSGNTGSGTAGASTPPNAPIATTRNTNDKMQDMIAKTLDSVKTALALNLPMDNIKDRGKGLTPDIQLKFRTQLEQRLIREIRRMYDSGFFFYSYEYDLTNTVQRTAAANNAAGSSAGILPRKPLWRGADERFFWNKSMCIDLIGSLVASRRASVEVGATDDEGQPHSLHDIVDRWVLPVVQGYVSLIRCRVGSSDFEVALISRRSRHRAGTRYRRRGIDASGNVANYVETEQIVRFEGHTSAFVQVRGSVPVFWTQSGRQYRPLARLDPTKTADETLAAFRVHFGSEVARYGSKVVVVNLLERTGGQEMMLCNSFADNILRQGSDDVGYYEFDFHLHCKGMKYENVSLLIDQLDVCITDMRHSWVSPTGQLLCTQQGICRTNCLDCLDRTNVVQSAIARRAFAAQLMRFGILSPEQSVSGEGASALQEAWANNGDAISRQYAGTSAMKSDYTRTGKRNWHGMMNDGYNSLARYFMNNFRDVYRQAVIDLQLGIATPEDILASSSAETSSDGDGAEEAVEGEPSASVQPATEEEWNRFREDSYADALATCKSVLVPNNESQIGGWILVEVEGNGHEHDVVLLLTDLAFYLADYSFDSETVESFLRVPLNEIRLIKKGNFSTSRGNLSGFLSSRAVAKQFGFRIYSGNRAGADVASLSTDPTSPVLAPAVAPTSPERLPEIALGDAAGAGGMTQSPRPSPAAAAPAPAPSASPSAGRKAGLTFNSATAAFARLFGTSGSAAGVRRGSAGDLLATSPPSAGVALPSLAPPAQQSMGTPTPTPTQGSPQGASHHAVVATATVAGGVAVASAHTSASSAPASHIDGAVHPTHPIPDVAVTAGDSVTPAAHVDGMHVHTVAATAHATATPAVATPAASPGSSTLAPVQSPSVRPRSGTKGSLIEHTLRVSVSRTSEDAKVVTDDICDKFAALGPKFGYTMTDGVLERGSNLLQTMNKIQSQIVSKIQSQMGSNRGQAASGANARAPPQSKLTSKSTEDVPSTDAPATAEAFHDVEL